MINKDNLKVPTSEEAREYGSKGGKASGESRKRKRMLQDALQKALKGVYSIDADNVNLGGYDALAISLIKEALSGDVKAFLAIRDTIGEKPVEEITTTIKNQNLITMQEYLEDAKNGKLKKNKTKQD